MDTQANKTLSNKYLATPGLQYYQYPDDTPTTILQFGTGMLLRGLIGDMVERSNADGSYKGKIAVVKSTGNDVSEFRAQNNIYSLLVKGIEQGKEVDEVSVNSSIANVFGAGNNWKQVLNVAADPSLQTIVSNTTEAGLIYKEELIQPDVSPDSFPAKLFACLLHRYKTFNGDKEKGVVILPMELVDKNGELLLNFVTRHAANNKASDSFIEWIKNSNFFCNTIVDRIVPGKTEKNNVVEINGHAFTDNLHVTAEPYNLLAVQGNETIKRKIGFGENCPGFIVAPSIEDLKEQKLRLLNGANTLVASPALLAGLVTTYDTMEDEDFERYTTQLMQQEILPTIRDICPEADNFTLQVLDRFRNPFIRYPLINICFQATSKMNSRVMETINRQYRLFGKPGPLTLIGLAAWFIYYTPAGKDEGGNYTGSLNGKQFNFKDDKAPPVLHELASVKNGDYESAVNNILQNRELFRVQEAYLDDLGGLVSNTIQSLLTHGVRDSIKEVLKK